MPRKGSPRNHYTVYLRKTDEIVAVGTAEECALQLGLKRGSFYTIVGKTLKGVLRKYEFIVENSAYDEEDE